MIYWLRLKFFFDLLYFKEQNRLDISRRGKDEPQILVCIFPMCEKCFYEIHCFPEHPSRPQAGAVLLCSPSSCVWLWMDWKINQYQAEWPSQPGGYSAQLALHLHAAPLSRCCYDCHVYLCDRTWCCIHLQIQPYRILWITPFAYPDGRVIKHTSVKSCPKTSLMVYRIDRYYEKRLQGKSKCAFYEKTRSFSSLLKV